MEKEVLEIEGMSCDHCKARVEKALGELVGVSAATVSLEEGTATVSFDASKVTQTQMAEAVEEAGYEVV
ncbi:MULTISPECIES: copper ion binding protein [Listeria]|uniref:copper ion binding protein n=1 Tax=Listeria TaxID=1637 RepID=UPI000B587B27|nr:MULTISPECIES: copper ion binding protein [Listeria]